jgi:uncharacterized protein (TIGR02145 family)
MKINAPWRFLPLLACILAVAFFACSKEDKQLASGYTEEGNAWNGLDSTVAEILRTWDPEIPVDSVERRGTGANEGKSWYQVDFATDGQEFYSYDAAADSMTCAVKIFGEENGVRLDLQASAVQMSISQVLTRDSLEAVVTDRMDVTYSGEGVVESCRADSTKFALACAEESGEMVDRFALEACTELHLVCVRRLQTPPLTAKDFLVATAQSWIELYGDQSVMVDSRDGQVYRIVDVGGVTWMAQNLNYAYRAPTSLWDSTSFCYDDDPAMCEKHGRLYTFAAVIDSAGLLSDEGKGCGFQVMCNLGRDVQGICPDGWRIPNYDEYTALIEAAGGPGSDGEGVAGRNLKAVEYGGTDVFGFSMLVSGRHIEFERMSDPESESLYDYIDNAANYWTITESTSEALLAYRFFADYDYVGHDQVTKYIAHPLRCVKGEAPKFAPGQIDPAEVVKSTFTDSRDGTVYNTVKVADQVWMAEYLRYAADGAAVCYDNLEENCEKYGMLYPSANPEDSTETGLIQSYCPDGWHLPSLDEYLVLAQHAGPSFVGLKSTEGWTVRAGNGTNEYGFNALPGGRGVMKNDTLSFNSMGEEALFWLSTYDDFMDSLYVVIPPLSGPTTLSNYSLVSARSYAYIRCLQD